MVGFTYHPMIVKLVCKWILEYDFNIVVPSHIMRIYFGDEAHEDDNEKAENLINIDLKMSIYHKYYFVKTLCASIYLNEEEKI
jgi:hypothetical protein